MKIKFKQLSLSIVLVTAISLISSCEDPYLVEETGDDDRCVVGIWQKRICDGNEWQHLNFYADGTGAFADYDCTGQCYRIAKFNWSESTPGTIYYDYTSFEICSEPQPISNGSQTYSCSGNTLTVGGTDVYERAP